MRRLITVVVSAVLLWAGMPVLAVPDFANALHYTPPPTYFASELNHDPGDNPFSGDGPGFVFLANDQQSQIQFQIALMRFSVGQGKRIQFLSTNPSDLKGELEADCKNRFPQTSPAVIHELGGLTAITLTASRPSGGAVSFFQFNWVQLETNIVLKITAIANGLDAFKTITNSFQSLKIDKAKLFESLQPKKPEVMAEPLERVEVGYVRRASDRRHGRIAAFIFHCGSKAFSFTAVGNGDPAEPINQVIPWLLKFQSSPNPHILRAAVIEIAREGSTDYYEKTCGFAMETNSVLADQLKQNDFRAPVSLRLLYWSESQEPAGFEKTGEYRMHATLLIRKTVF